MIWSIWIIGLCAFGKEGDGGKNLQSAFCGEFRDTDGSQMKANALGYREIG